MQMTRAIKTTQVGMMRPDLRVIADLLTPGSKVLDLGCGDGGFLRYLVDTKQVEGLGVEIDQKLISQCIANGVNVIHSDLDRDFDFADDQSFDYVILNHTLQVVKHPERLVEEIVRIGRVAVVSLINFGYWINRLQLLINGRMPRSENMPYEWYDTPNIHFCTIRDFRILCAERDIELLQEIPLVGHGPLSARWIPNWFATGCVFILRKRG